MSTSTAPPGTGTLALARAFQGALPDGAATYVGTPKRRIGTPTSPARPSATATCLHHLNFPTRRLCRLAAVPRRWRKPYQLIRTVDADGGLDWAAVTAPLPEPRR